MNETRFVPIITVTNQKGGVAKTTTADAISDGLRRRGMRVLAVDTDPQGSLGAIQARCVADGSCCCSSFFKGLPVIPTEDGQATVPGDLGLSMVAGEHGRDGAAVDESSLREAIYAAVERHGFDAVVIDTQPGMTFLTISALIAATHVIIPTTADRLGVEAIAQDAQFFDELAQTVELNWADDPAVVITLYRGMANLSRTFAEQIDREVPTLGFKVFWRRVPTNVMVQEAQATQTSMFDQSFFRGRMGAKVMQAAAAEYDMLVDDVRAWIWPELEADVDGGRAEGGEL